MHDAAGNGAEPFGVLGLTADTHGEQRTAVERLLERDDLVLLLAEVVESPAPRQLERCFVGLAAGRAEVRLVGEGPLDHLLGQRQCRLVGIDVREVPQLVGLLRQRADQRRMTVPQRIDRDTASEIDVLLARLIPQAAPLAAHRNRLLGRIVGGHVAVEIVTCRARGHVFLPEG